MKKLRFSKIALVVAFGLLSYACQDSFLDKPALGALSDAQLSTKAGVDNLLIGAYAALDGNGVGAASAWDAAADNWIYGSIAGGDAKKGSDGADQPGINSIMIYSAGPSNGFFNSKWKAVYEGINRANTVLKFVPLVTSGMTDAEKTSYSAQARFLRGHYYSELKKMFNMVPWVDETTENPAAVKNDVDIWPNIEADFKYAMDNLPATQSDVGRVNKWAAAAYLGKTYLYEKKFAEAKTTFDQVISSGVTSNGIKYDLMPQYQDNFDAAKKNMAESVFAIQMAANDGTNTIDNANTGGMLNFPYNSPFRCCGFYQPSLDLANSFQTDANGLPLVDNYNATTVKNDMGIKSDAAYTPDGTVALDPRIDWTVGRRGIPFLDWGNHPGQAWIRDQSYAGPYSPKKNMYYQATQDKYSDQHSWAPGTAINVLVIRFADVLLMAAEAEAQAGSLEKAQEYVNRVRARAAKPESWVYTYADPTKPMGGYTKTPAANYKVAVYPAGAFAAKGKDGALKAIYFERKLELAMEGHRFFDLSRWGIAETTLNAYVAFESKITPDVSGGKFVKSRNEYFPIPQTQIDLSTRNGVSSLKQNPGYQ
ncbi:RagB/SusD family nutrient uptake outer membrane protein [Dyadobacter subterraneus]|uniref:RagB/SusD family nutrient uptake outer membrane protein n=1 Tax=Dyadobacter subterraneus TaxID=2773304 RepID=A0ABR9W6H6_9BACT|nr:RagB/SusD family nutrient uptake outer membrane protein [Dyadobacter subterraneus]MBE9461070.1 RagB/SusD family nutrient uptake outer membrane protein [Dyadobacter subterraneus]